MPSSSTYCRIAATFLLTITAACCLPAAAQPQGANTRDFSNAIRDLGSETFAARQQSAKELLAAGSAAIEALELGAKHEELEVAKRCIDILSQMVRGRANSNAARTALEALAGDPSANIADYTAGVLKELNTTDEDRAIEVLEAEGARINRRRNGDVFSVTLARDGQIALAKYLSNPRSIRLMGKGITDAGIAALAELSGFTNLTITGTAVTDTGLRGLQHLDSLTSLSLAGNLFTGDGLRQLRRVPQLRSLTLLSAVGEDDLSFLVDLPQLDSLYLTNVAWNERSVDVVNRLNQLTRVSVTGMKFSDEQLGWIGRIEVPLRLSVMMSPAVTDAGIKHLETAQLVSLMLTGTPITDQGLASVGKMLLLESLMIIDAPISDAGLAHLENLQKLRSVTLRDTKTTAEGVARLHESLPNLRRVNAAANQFQRPRPQIRFTDDAQTGRRNAHLRARPTKEVVDQLKKTANLGSVFLHRDCQDEDLLAIAGLPIRGLIIDSPKVTDRALQHFEGHATLETLSVWSSAITDAALRSIARIPSLEELAIHDVLLTDTAVQELIQEFDGRGKLKTLHFFRCHSITNDGLKGLGRLASLERLFLNNNDGLTGAILHEIHSLHELRRLELDSVPLVDESSLDHLPSFAKLETLSWSNPGEPGFTNLAMRFLGELSELRSLNIGGTRVTDAGVEQIVKLDKLRRLGLNGTGISDASVKLIADSLPHLSSLGLSSTAVSSAAMEHVAKLTELEWLQLAKTQVGDDGVRRLDRLEKLKYLSIDPATVSSSAHQHVQQTHPNAHIEYK